MSEFIKKILLHDFMDSIFSGYIVKITGVAVALAGIFLLINIAHMYWTGAIGGKRLWHFPEFMRCIVLIVAIPILPTCMKLLFGFAMAVCSSVEMNNSDRDQLVNYLDHKTSQFYKDYESKADMEKLKSNSYNHDNVVDKDGKVMTSKTNQSDVNLNKTVSEASNVEKESSWTDYFNWLGSPMEVFIWILDFILSWAFLIIKFVYSAFYIYFIKFLCLIGPLALAFSILPFAREKASEWFGVLWNALFVFTTFNILDGLMKLNIEVTEKMFFSTSETGTAFSLDSSMPRICFSLVMCILYLKVPYITSLFAGSSAGNTVFRDGLQTLTSFASGFVGGMAGGASGAAASSNNTQRQSSEPTQQSSSQNNNTESNQ